MKLTNIVWTTAIIAAAIILTAVLSTATLSAAGTGGASSQDAGNQSETGTAAPVAPRFLSLTGLYGDAATFKIDSRNRTFSPKFALWNDGVTKRRWVRLPAGSNIDVADLARWELPVGTKFWKEFSVNGKKVETRLLWRTSKDNWVVASYIWNAAQTDAELASASGLTSIAEIVAR